MKNKLKKRGIIILILVALYILNIVFWGVYAKNSSIEIRKIINLMTSISILLILLIIIAGIVFIIELFKCCISYCGTLAEQKGFPESYKWFGLLLIIGIVILMFATPAQEGNKLKDSTADELIKFKELYNKEIITEEEFLQKKKELLGK